MTNESYEHGSQGRKFDLEERTAAFGERIILFARRIPSDPITKPLISQLIRAAGSVGANYCEADEASSKKEFRYRISLCKKEARESQHWLRLLATSAPAFKAESRTHWKEAHELTLIFAAIHRNSAEI